MDMFQVDMQLCIDMHTIAHLVYKSVESLKMVTEEIKTL